MHDEQRTATSHIEQRFRTLGWPRLGVRRAGGVITTRRALPATPEHLDQLRAAWEFEAPKAEQAAAD